MNENRGLFKRRAIAVTEKCNAECDICSLYCGPDKTRTLETKDMKRAIRQAGSVAGMEEICFTGGEPLLYFDRVMECVAYASSLGLRSAVYTNGFWGNDEKRAREWVQALKRAGVCRVHYSSDSWHQKYVPFAALETAMRCSREAGLENDLSIMIADGTGHFKQAMKAMPEECRTAKLLIHPMFPVGRAKDRVEEKMVLKLFNPDKAFCIYDKMAVLMFDGYYYLCCSMYEHSSEKIRIGHMNEVSFADLERLILSDDELVIMLKDGFGWYMQKMREAGYDVPDKVCFHCECCQMVFNNRPFLEAIHGQVKEYAQMLREVSDTYAPDNEGCIS